MIPPMKKVALLICVLAACGSSEKKTSEPAPLPEDPAAKTDPAGPPAPAATDDNSGEIDPEWKRMGDMAVDLFRKLHGVVVANKDNCDAMGGGLSSLVDDNQAFIKEAKGYETNKEFSQWFNQTYGPELAKLFQELGPALQGCKDNAKVNEAMQRFGGAS